MTQSTNAPMLADACAIYALSIGDLVTPRLSLQREFDAKSFGVLISLATARSQSPLRLDSSASCVTQPAAPALRSCCARALDVIAARVVLRGSTVASPCATPVISKNQPTSSNCMPG
jgi:hypothetical protein